MQGERKRKKSKVPFILTGIILILAAGVGFTFYQASRKGNNNPDFERAEFDEPIYNALTGLEISDASLNSAPTYCIQIPNGADGGRPQAGLADAAVVFEAIAEAGITRFAAVFQNAQQSAIGPIRSLRPYYLDWDTPFDCTVVHAGGSSEALAAIAAGGQRNLDTDGYNYAWRENSEAVRRWNNAFTSPVLLNSFNQERDYDTSTPKAFARLTPSEAEERHTKVAAGCEAYADDGPEINADHEPCDILDTADTIRVNFGNIATYNVIYEYDTESNSYLRSHGDDDPHLVYSCASNLDQPYTLVACGDPVQLSPKVVAVIRVSQSKMADNYHENITTIGSGSATIFQNGEVITGTWEKPSQDAQITFKDKNGDIIKLTPGQVFIEAVSKTTGSLYY